MADIQVLFQKPGPDGMSNVVVLNDPQPVFVEGKVPGKAGYREPVHWHFQVEPGASIDRVRITFEHENVKYFQDPVTKLRTHTIDRILEDGDTIYGCPPAREHPDHENTSEEHHFKMHGYRDKYTIFGYRNGVDKPVAVKDPEIVPIRP